MATSYSDLLTLRPYVSPSINSVNRSQLDTGPAPADETILGST